MSSHFHNVPELFKDTVEKHRDRAALILSDREVVTFRELDRLSNKAVRVLRKLGVHKGDRVGICLDKCSLAYALIVACLKIGAPYFMIDPVNPFGRIAVIVDTCRPRIATAMAVQTSGATTTRAASWSGSFGTTTSTPTQTRTSTTSTAP